MKLIILSLAVCAFALAEGRFFTSQVDVASGQIVDYYTCTAQGNYPDPRTCDHYIACTAANIAYQMPCATGSNGKRLFYVRDSGPREEESYCDYPENVDCTLDEGSEEATEEPTQAPTRPPTHAPTDPTRAPTQAPTAAPTSPPDLPPNVNGTCPADLLEGADCDPMTECQQCGHCDEYFFCQADSPTSGKWVRNRCSVRGNPATDVIRVQDKMFFHRGATAYGGICAPGIPSELEEEYIRDPNCKNPCEFRADPECVSAYFYSDPDYTRGIWSDPGTRLLCPTGTKWDQSVLTCVFCADGEACDCTPPTA